MGYFKKKLKAIKKEYEQDAKARSNIRKESKKESYRAKLMEEKRYVRAKAKINTDKRISYAKSGGFMGSIGGISKSISSINPKPKKKVVVRRIYIEPTRKIQRKKRKQYSPSSIRF